MATGRNRSMRKLKPWLVEQIESGKYHGLVWDDDLKMCFRIPWKHAGKQDFRHDEDAAIFKAWAEYKNKYKNGDKADPAVWKTRFRCALNKSPEFHEVPERSQLDVSEPYKVYRIVPLQEQDIDNIYYFKGRYCGDKDMAIFLNNVVNTEKPSQQIKAYTELHIAEMSEMGSCASADSGNGSDSNGADTLYTDQQAAKPELCQPDLSSSQKFSGYQCSCMQITILYSGLEVSKCLVHSGECKLSASAPIFSGMEHVLLPAPCEPLDKDTCKKTESLLQYLKAGVMLASNTDGIFAQRQKKCSGRIFWIGPCVNSHGEINKLERDEHVKLFDTHRFLQELETYKTMGGVPPLYYVTLCFGEEVSDKDPTEDKLITAKIEQVMAYEMVQQATLSLLAPQTQDSSLEEPTFSNLTPLMPVDTLDSIYS
ncbi:interferon regulatory factor 9 [Gastrophryne carolinensis]